MLFVIVYAYVCASVSATYPPSPPASTHPMPSTHCGRCLSFTWWSRRALSISTVPSWAQPDHPCSG